MFCWQLWKIKSENLYNLLWTALFSEYTSNNKKKKTCICRQVIFYYDWALFVLCKWTLKDLTLNGRILIGLGELVETLALFCFFFITGSVNKHQLQHLHLHPVSEKYVTGIKNNKSAHFSCLMELRKPSQIVSELKCHSSSMKPVQNTELLKKMFWLKLSECILASKYSVRVISTCVMFYMYAVLLHEKIMYVTAVLLIQLTRSLIGLCSFTSSSVSAEGVFLFACLFV